MPKIPEDDLTNWTGVDSWTKLPITVALCPYDKPSTHLKSTGCRAHPSVAKFFKLYPDVAAWVRAHPGQAAGRLLKPIPKDLTYYRYRYNGVWKYNYARRREVPVDAEILSWKQWIKGG